VCYALYIIGYGFHHHLENFAGGTVAHVIVFILLVILLGYLEGLKNALLTTSTLNFNDDPKWMAEKPRGVKLQNYMISPRVIERFLVGRQFFTVFVMFVISRVTAFNFDHEPGWEHWPRWALTLCFETGLASGVMVVLVFGSLLPQLLASSHPLSLLQLPGSNLVCYLCVFLANLGLIYMAWGGAKIIKCFLEPFEIPPPMVKHGNRTTDCTCTCQCGAPRVFGYDPKHVRLTQDVDLLAAIDVHDDHWAEMESLIARGSSGAFVAAANAVEHARGLEPGHKFPHASEFRDELMRSGKPVPHFLLPAHDPKYVPPHIVCIKLLLKYGDVLQRASETGLPEHVEARQGTSSPVSA